MLLLMDTAVVLRGVSTTLSIYFAAFENKVRFRLEYLVSTSLRDNKHVQTQ